MNNLLCGVTVVRLRRALIALLASTLLVGLPTTSPADAAAGPDSFACSVDEAALSWTDNAQERYWVYRSTDDGASYQWIGRTLGDTTFVDRFPQIGAKYQVHYAGIPRVECTVIAEPTTSYVPFSCTVVRDELTWTDDAQEKYWIYRSIDDGASYQWIGRTTGETSFFDLTAEPGAKYQVHYAGIPRVECATFAERGVAAGDGVWLHTAGASGPGGTAICSGLPGGTGVDSVVNDALASLQLLGTEAAQIIDYQAGDPGEIPDPTELDETPAEVIEGLQSIDDFGTIANDGDDDSANVDIGTNGAITLQLPNGQAVFPDGTTATGSIVSNPDDPAAALDGSEILIFEDAEFSGMNITLFGPSDVELTLSLADYAINPNTANSADDSVVAIDLDGLISSGRFAGPWVNRIRIADDNDPTPARSSTCEVAWLIDTSLEIDAVAVATGALQSVILDFD